MPHEDRKPYRALESQAESPRNPNEHIPKEVRLNKEKYLRNLSAQQAWLTNASIDLDFVNGRHWTKAQAEKLESRRQQASVIEIMYQIVDQAVSTLTARSPRYSATARENSDKRWAHVAAETMQWIWQKSDGDLKVKKAIWDYYVMGRGVLVAYIDPDADFGKGDVLFDDVDPRDVFPDPTSRHPLWDDADDIVIRRLFTKSQIKQRWQDVDLTNVVTDTTYPYGDVGQDNDTDVQVHPDEVNRVDHTRTYEVIERYTKEMRTHYRIIDPTSGMEEVYHEERYQERREEPAYILERRGEQTPITDPQEVAQFDQIYDAIGEVFHLVHTQPQVDPATGQPVEQPPQMVPGDEGQSENAIPGSTTRLFPTTIGALINQDFIPVVEFMQPQVRVVGSVGDSLLYEPFYLPTRHYPVVVFPNSHNRNPYTISDVRRTKSLQENINKMNSLILAHLANSTNLKVFYPENSVADAATWESEWQKAGAAFIPYNPEFGERGGIEIVQPPQVSAALFAHFDRQIALMERIFGVFSVGAGDPAQQATTATGTIFMDEVGLRRLNGKLKDIYRSLSRLGTICFEFAQDIYTEEKTLRIVNPEDGASRLVRINVPDPSADYSDAAAKINDITKGQYDMMVVVGSTLPSNRWARLQEYKELFQLGIVDDRAVLENSEIPDSEQILERSGVLKQMQQTIAQLNEKVKDLEGDLQTARRAEVNALKRLEVEKDTAKTHQAVSDIQKSSEIFDAVMKAELDKNKAIIQAQRNGNNTNGSANQ